MMKMMLGLLTGACATTLTAGIVIAAIIAATIVKTRTPTLAIGSSTILQNRSGDLRRPDRRATREPARACAAVPQPAGPIARSFQQSPSTHARSLNPRRGLTAGDQSAKIPETLLAARRSAVAAPAPKFGWGRKAMPKRAQTHGIVSRQGWLSFTPEPFRRGVLDRC